MKKVFWVFALSLMLTACGGGSSSSDTGSGDTTGDQTPIDGNGDAGDTDCTVTYTTVAEMPIYVDFRFGNSESPWVRLNLGCDRWIEFDLYPNCMGLMFQTESTGSEQIWFDDPNNIVPISFADGYTLMFNRQHDCTITTPSGETLQFQGSAMLSYENTTGTTFDALIWQSIPTIIGLIVKGVRYGRGPMTFALGEIIPNTDPIAVQVGIIGYEAGHKWGFDPLN